MSCCGAAAEFSLFFIIDRLTARTTRELQRKTERNKLMNQQQERRKEEEPRIEVDLISGRLKVLTRHVDKWRRRGGSVEITTTLSTKTRIRTKQEIKKEGSNCCITVVCSFFVPLFSN